MSHAVFTSQLNQWPEEGRETTPHADDRLRKRERENCMYETNSQLLLLLHRKHLADGSTYEGEWENEQANGHGKQSFSDNSVYEGEFKDSVFHGLFSCQHVGNAHILSFSSHTGQGKLTFADGTIMEGSWEDGNIVHGRQLKYSDGFLYVGDFKDSMFHGKGKSPLLRCKFKGVERGGKPHRS